MATRQSKTGPSAAGIKALKLDPAVLAVLTDEQKLALVKTSGTKSAANGSGFDLDTATASEVHRSKRSERTALVIRKLTDGKAIRYHVGVEVTPDKGEPFYKKGGPMLTVAEFKALQAITV